MGQITPSPGLEYVAVNSAGQAGVYSAATGLLLANIAAPFDYLLAHAYLIDVDGDGYSEVLCISSTAAQNVTPLVVQKYVSGAMVAQFPALGLALNLDYLGTMRLTASNPNAMVFQAGTRVYIVRQNGVIRYDSASDAQWPNDNGAVATVDIGDYAGTGYDQVHVELTSLSGSRDLLIGDQSLAPAAVDDASALQAKLLPSSPNPAAGPVRIGFELPAAAQVQLLVYDAQGRVVNHLANGRLEAGRHEQLWDGRDLTGTRVRPGAYFYELVVDGAKETRKLVQLR